MMTWPVALGGRTLRIRRAECRSGTSLSSPTRATWTRGRVVTRRALPSLLMMPRVPVSAMAKLAPEIPMSAVRKALRNSRRATFTRLPMSGLLGLAGDFGE